MSKGLENSDGNEKSIDRELIKSMLGKTLDKVDLPQLGGLQRGKVRDCYIKGDKRYLIVTDRVSAFDVVLGSIPIKGQVLNAISVFWFDLTKDIAPNHVLDVPDPNVLVAEECRPLPAEMVMRGYLTGSSETSIWRAYERGDREFCGHRLPEGMKKHQKLATPLLTPSTKAEQGDHDRSVSRKELISVGNITEKQFDEMEEYSKALFAFGQKKAAEKGLILVDTKYEFGVNRAGKIVLIDEVHTPDSSRYWYADDYDQRHAKGLDPRSLDKEFVRRYLREERGFTGDGPAPELPEDVVIEAAYRYLKLYSEVTGEILQPDTRDPLSRLKANLGVE